MKFLLFLTLSITPLTSKAQIVNSMSADKSGIYFFSVDTVISYFQSENNLGAVYIKGNAGNKIDRFPLNLRKMEVQNLPCDVDCVKRMKQDDVLLTLSDISIIRDQYSISIKAQQRKGKKLERFADYVYFLQFKYSPQSQTYTLRQLKKGLDL